MSITAATKWPTNAEMIVDIVELGYIRPNDSVIDLTFGGGKWWTLYAHAGLFVANHLSWLDIFCIAAVCPTHFLAKQEVTEELGRLGQRAALSIFTRPTSSTGI